MASNFEDIQAMHEHFGFAHSGEVRFLSDQDFLFRTEFLHEELVEFCDACESKDLPTAIDSLVDLVVVAMGTAVMMGITPERWTVLWDDVHRANMSKIRGRTDRGVDNDLQKPPGWVPPKTKEIIEAFDHDLLRPTSDGMTNRIFAQPDEHHGIDA